jgi:ATP-dependent DNA helicase RecG
LDFKIADLVRDEKLVVYTRNLAMSLLDNDPDLSKTQNAPIASYLAELMKRNVYWGMIS